LEQLGVDLTAPRPIDIHFFAPDLDSARLLVTALKSAGYPEALLGKISAVGGGVSVTASAFEAPASVASPTMVKALVTLAKGVGAIHDGWGTSVQPPSTAAAR